MAKKSYSRFSKANPKELGGLVIVIDSDSAVVLYASSRRLFTL